ncbi:AP2-like ethylene-responsive transcription factor At1g16060 [Elaeis guineensis]|uniref:Ethylene-responsive transcription factor WRI1 n=1 Tax=Elaeis guineensis var. tenera TaxID=51953 RepID=A0A6I9RSR0_ELAGV|nr:ethylene-responsive transcription factor WRI1 [Elaeis guineensis]
MKKSPPSPPPPSSRSSSSSPSNYAPLSSSNVIPVNKPQSKSKSKPKQKKGKNPDKAHSESIRRRSSIYRGVTRHRWTGRFEAHLWDKNWQHPLHNKRGRQVYLGAYDAEVDAARTHDLAALKFCGPEAILNFPVEMYTGEYREMQTMSREEWVASLRRRSNGFARGVSKYRGVARHHNNGRWEARLGLVLGYKYLYLGTYETEEEAAQAYDLAALQFKGPNAVTNFDSCSYVNCPRPFMELPPKLEMEQGHQEFSPLQEARVVPMEPTKFIDQTVPSDDILDTITSSIISMDEFFDAYSVLDLTTGCSDDLRDISGNIGFEDDIEHFFEGFETLTREEGQIKDGGAKEDMESQVNSVSHPLQISICS